MNFMETIKSASKVYNKMFKCIKCGRKSVSLGNEGFNYKMTSKEDTEDESEEENEFLDDLTDLNDEWTATCSHCGWSDS